MMRIVLTTCRQFPDIISDDEPLRAALIARGCDVCVAQWNGPFLPFEDADLVLIRTPWDYIDHAVDFLSWLSRLEAVGARVINQPSLLRWNMNKRYLVDLEKRGALLPLTFVSARDPANIVTQANICGLKDIVVKPVISSSSIGLSRISSISHANVSAALDGIEGDVLVQDFVPEIQTAGETSLIFFGGDFSHAVRKQPKAGDIRCQKEFGGIASGVSVSEFVIVQAAAITELLPEKAAYARIDVIIKDQEIVLMEVEVIEPELFFGIVPNAAENFARVLVP